MKHTQADIDARNLPLGRVIAWMSALAFVSMVGLAIYAALYPPACTRVDIWQFSVCL